VQRLKAYRIFANTKDKRLMDFLKDPQSLKQVSYQSSTLKNLSLEHFIYVLHKFHDFAFLKEIIGIISNTMKFQSKYSIQKDYGKIVMDNGHKIDYSLDGRINIILEKVKKVLENHDRI
jgi:hypothetical protein